MDAFRNSKSGFRTLVEHPTPWRYVSSFVNPSEAAIVDADDKVVVSESQVTPVVFDFIWAAYFDLLRE